MPFCRLLGLCRPSVSPSAAVKWVAASTPATAAEAVRARPAGEPVAAASAAQAVVATGLQNFSVSPPLSPHSRSFPSQPVIVSLLLWAEVGSAPEPPVIVSLPLPPSLTVTST